MYQNPNLNIHTLREKCPNMERVFSGPYLPVFGLNTGKYGPDKAPYLDTFHTVILFISAGPFFQEDFSLWISLIHSCRGLSS